MKKICIFLALVLLLSGAFTAQAATRGAMTYDNFYCNYDYTEPYTDGVIVITGLLNPNVTMLTVPGEIAGVTVNIAPFAFEKSPYLKTVIIEDGVEEIGKGAFYECGELASVFIPDSVKKIGSRVFEGCGKLTYAPIPLGAAVEEDDKEPSKESAEEAWYKEIFVPVRELAEKGSVTVSWDGEAREVTLTGLKNEVKLCFGKNFINEENRGMAIGYDFIYVNGEEIETGSAALIIDGVTYVRKAVVDALFGEGEAADLIWGLLTSFGG